MNGFIKLFCLTFVLSLLASCVPTEIGTVAQCGANEAYDAVKRICYNTTVPHQPPTPTLARIDMIEDQAVQEFVLSYKDVDGDLATNCSIVSRADGIDDVTYNCQCQGGVCTVRVQPDPDFSGYTELVYSLTDINGVSAGKSVAVYVAVTNDPPIASNVSVAVVEDTVKTFTLAATDQDGDSFYFVKLSDPSKGSLSFNGATGSVTYTPGLNDFGTQSFLYKVCDYGTPTMCSSSYTATLNISAVDDAPVANNVAGTVAEGGTSAVVLSYSDVENDAATACAGVSTALDLTVNSCSCVAGVCSLNVTSVSDFNGVVNVSYTVTANGKTSAVATAAVTVTPVNDAPVIGLTDPALSVVEGTVINLTTANAAFVLGEGGSGNYEASQSSLLNITWTTINPIPASAKVVEKVEIYYDSVLKGSFTTNNSTSYVDLGDGTNAVDASKLKVVVTPKAYESGKLRFTFKLRDSETPALTTTAINNVNIEVIETNDPPVISSIDAVDMNEGDEPYTHAFTIEEGAGDTEDNQTVSFTLTSDNAALVPVNNISAAYRHLSQTSRTALVPAGVVFTIPNNFSPPITTDLNSGNYLLYLKINPVDGVSGTANITVVANDGSTTSSRSFTVTVNPIGANHGGWTKISARGSRTDRFGTAVTGIYSTPVVELAWNNFDTATSASNSNHVISGWRVFRRTTGTEYDWESPITGATDIDANTFTYQDTTVSESTVYYYTVRPVDSSTLKLTIPTNEVFSEVRLFVPPANDVFVHRWMMNQEVCKMMLMTETSSDPAKRVDPTNNFRCPYQGPGETAGYYDIGKDLVVDAVEVGCPYTKAPACSSNGCIGLTTPAHSASYSGYVFYNRSTGSCLINSGTAWLEANNYGCPYSLSGSVIPAPTGTNGTIFLHNSTGICYIEDAGAWKQRDIINLYPQVVADSSRNSFLPPLVNISQERANEFCHARSQLTNLDYSASEAFFSLPTRKEQIAYSAWDEQTDFQINDYELGQYINSSSKCNSSAASGVSEYYSDNTVPSTSYLFSIPGTKTSNIRSIYTGSQSTSGLPLTNMCYSRYGIQDVYGNVSEWTLDRFICYPPGHPKAYTCAALTIDLEAELFAQNAANPATVNDVSYLLRKLVDLTPTYDVANDYDVTDSLFDSYILDGIRGPCQDSLNNDGICDSPMTSWAIEKTNNLAGLYIFPVGLPARTDYTLNFPYSDVSEYLLPIGSTQGIEIEKLHSDTIALNTYPIYNNANVYERRPNPSVPAAFLYEGAGLASVATGGSNLTTSDSGRYSMELTPVVDVQSTPASQNIGSNYIMTTLNENERDFGGLRVKTFYPYFGSNFTFQVTSSGVADTSCVTVNLPSSSVFDRDIIYECGTLATLADLRDAINSPSGSDTTRAFYAAIPNIADETNAVVIIAQTTFTPYLSFRLKQAYAHLPICIDYVVDSTDTVTYDNLRVDAFNNGSTMSCYRFIVHISPGTLYSDIKTIVEGGGTAAVSSAGPPVVDATDIEGLKLTALVDVISFEDPAPAFAIRATDYKLEYRLPTHTAILSSQLPVSDGVLNLDISYTSSTATASYNSTSRTASIAIPSTYSTFDLANLINTSPALSGVLVAEDIFPADGLVSSTVSISNVTTGTGDLIISSKSSGVLWNSQKVSFIHVDGQSGSEYAEYDSDHIRVYIESGVTTAQVAGNAMLANSTIANLFNISLSSPSRANSLQGSFSNINLVNGVDNTPNRRSDIGFRCVAPVESAHYPADLYHNYSY